MNPLSLDDAVDAASAALEERGFPAPRVVFLLATGSDPLRSHLTNCRELELGALAGVPEPWRTSVLAAGSLGTLPVWVLDDVSGEPRASESLAPWAGGFPLWLAAARGASIAVHASAGCGLLDTLPAGGLALLSDHVNFSGSSPLLGLGASKLGPVFPDLSRLHHGSLRAAALQRARGLGLAASETVGACTGGPALETPAELAMLARLGAGVAVQSLATPLLAAGHAGLAVLAIVAVTDSAGQSLEVARLVERAAQLGPALEELLLELVPDFQSAAHALAQEVGT